MKNIILVGFMGTGKTSVGKILGKLLNRPVVDVDECVESREGRRIADIFEKEGEAAFRRLEKKAVLELSKKNGVVITAGGGAVLDSENVSAFQKGGVLVALWARPGTILSRTKNSKHRPLLNQENRLSAIEKLLKDRKPYYEMAQLHFETDGQTPKKVAERILRSLKEKSIEV